MEIRASREVGILSSGFRWLRAARRLKWLVVGAIALSFVMVVPLASMYYGMVLLKTGGATTVKGWATTVSRDKFLFAINYVNSLWVQPERLTIDISFKNFQKLAHKREQAMAVGTLIAEDDDWVSAQIRHGTETYRVDLKLKGELGDHWWHHREWSFKVNVKGDETIFGMKRFALQAPRTRKFMNEWVFQRFLEHAGLINLRSDFVSVVVNGKKMPIYMIEENFDKRLIERNRRREGPIFRFHAGMYRANPVGSAESFLGSPIEPYQPDRTARTPALMAQFDQAKNLIEAFRRGHLSATDVFDVKQLAMLFAITDLVGNSHASAPKNLKFYYNPLTSRVEPVGYDNTNIISLNENGVIGAGRKVGLGTQRSDQHRGWYEAFFEDPEFFQEYIRALRIVSENGYLDQFFRRFSDSYRDKLAILHKSYPWYHFDDDTLYQNQEYIRRLLDPDQPFHAYLESYDNLHGTLSLSFVNVYELPVEIMGVTIGDELALPLPSNVLLQGYHRASPPEPTGVVFKLPNGFPWRDEYKGQLRVSYRVLGTLGEATEAVHPWKFFDESFLLADRVRKEQDLGEVPFVRVDTSIKTIALLPGKWTLDQDLILPRGYTVTAGGGTTLDLVNGALILSYSPVTFIGTSAEPISIISSDRSGQGLFVVNADGTSRLEHVRFVDLAHAASGDWSLTGAVTFYESPIMIDHCLFTNIQAEDALNIIRSRFSVANTTFAHTFSDALDADFADGVISNSGFTRIGNDAIDISGSVVQLSGIEIDRAGDKGLSIGENSTLRGYDIRIRDTKIGVASKDDSEGNISRMLVRRAKVGFAVFRKKSEFGGASLTVSDADVKTTEQPYLVEESSRLILNGKVIGANRIKVDEFLNHLVAAGHDARPSL